MNKELAIALLVVYILSVVDIIAGTLRAKQLDKFDKDKFKQGLYKAGAIAVITFGLGIAFQLDNTLTFNDTPLLDYLIGLYQIVSGILTVQVIQKVGIFLGVFNEGED